jgi:hypothetical protein
VEATEILSALAVEEAHNLSAMFSLDLYELIVCIFWLAPSLWTSDRFCQHISKVFFILDEWWATKASSSDLGTKTQCSLVVLITVFVIICIQ